MDSENNKNIYIIKLFEIILKTIANITWCKRVMGNDCTIYPLKIWNLNPLINEIPQVQIGVKHE